MLGYLQLREPHPGAKAAVLDLPLVPCAPWERAPQASEPRARAFLSERPLELGPSGLLCSPGVTAGRHRRPHRAPTWGRQRALAAVARVRSPAGGPFPPPGRTQRSLQVRAGRGRGFAGVQQDSPAPLLTAQAPCARASHSQPHSTPPQPSRPAQPQLPASAQTSFQNAGPGAPSPPPPLPTLPPPLAPQHQQRPSCYQRLLAVPDTRPLLEGCSWLLIRAPPVA